MSKGNTWWRQARYSFFYALTRPLARMTNKSQADSEEEYALQCRRPIPRDRPAWVENAQRAAPEISKAGVAFLTTAHISGAFGTLAAISQAQHLANSSSIRFALVCFIAGTLCVGIDLFLAWQYNLHHLALQNLSSRPWSVRSRLWAEIDLLLLNLRGWAMFVSAALFFVGAILLTAAVFP